MNIQFDFSHLTNQDLVTLSVALALILLLFLFLLFTQRKHLAQLLKGSQYRVDLDRYEKQTTEAHQKLEHAKQNMDLIRAADRDEESDDLQSASDPDQSCGAVGEPPARSSHKLDQD